MSRIGFISGTALQHLEPFRTLRPKVTETAFGTATVHVSETLAYIRRHGQGPDDYILPHRINHAANLRALKDLGCTEVIGLNSVGSLKMHLSPGTIVVPHDFIELYGTFTVFSNRPVHVVPGLDEPARRRLIAAAGVAGIEVVASGIYWQTTGPRLETRAEIAMMTAFADMVGMTMAGEAVIACELELPYASLCSIDNYGHGLMATPPAPAQIAATARENADRMGRIVRTYLKHRPGTPP
ncbi:MAG: MTAP family purine nucleoside phosphorylase [Syntrophales bacterium]|nr:MTAP family purine nucleoside phosphorylase [Syntrophales bacterium]MDD4340443.1 MTAP family purine nucleoside phosphorylase [Syntrophales bacterium]HOS77457.1 MTAP family purine nucleoside phosphorylase [Syntrophales bacterium]HPB69516.1 MTAP family purine nucleoside phosphorylase [Syntrophales bacterium]HQN25199.1 MTAP family purine nucleoside phosphorylase [Syntrophales bacterium]